MVNFGDIEDRVRTQYEAASTVRWDSATILNGVNEGLDELSEATLFHERNATILLKGGHTYYDLRGFWPEGAFSINSIFNNTQQSWLRPVGIRDLKVQKWETVPGDPQRYMIRGLFWLGVYPRPSSDVGSLRVYFASMAPHFRDSYSVLSDLPDDFVPALEDYALYDLCCRDGETEKAMSYWDSYQAREHELEKFVKDRLSSRAGRLSG